MNFGKKNIIIAVLSVALIASMFSQLTSTCNVTGALTSEQAGQKALGFINTAMVQTGDATLSNVTDIGALYKLDLVVQGQEYVSYITKDGKTLFPSGVDIVQAAAKPATFDAPDAAKPAVDLYVMSFCPYGTLAEGLMNPVARLFGNKIDFNIRFIAHVSGNASDSLHGPDEALEDQRQLCIVKNYGNEKWWDYVTEVNSKCTLDTIGICWKVAAATSGVDVSKVESCVASEGLTLLAADEKLTTQYGVTGSPTLIINGEKFTGSRTSDAYKEGICTGFTTAPAECGQALSSEEQTASGGCG